MRNPRIWGKIPNLKILNYPSNFFNSLSNFLPCCSNMEFIASNMSGSFNSRNQQQPLRKSSGSQAYGENDGVVRCYCGHEAVIRVSRTAKNPGRQWYGCYLPKVS